MLSTSEIILEYVCPAAGMICANWMFMAPLADVRKAERAGTLGNHLNPTPWAVMLGNTLGWVSYALLRSNLFIFFANAPGFLLSIYFNVTAIKLLYKESSLMMAVDNDNDDEKALLQQVIAAHEQQQEENKEQAATTVALLEHEEQPTIGIGTAQSPETQQQHHHVVESSKKGAAVTPIATDNKIVGVVPNTLPATRAKATTTANHCQARLQTHERLVMLMIVLWLAIASLVISADRWDQDLKVMVLGLTVNCNLVFFYGAPLTIIRNVLATQCSAQLHEPTMIRNTANGVFWTAYGIAVLDWYVALPNGLGAALGVVQMILWVIFPRHPQEQEEKTKEEIGPVDPTTVNSGERMPDMAEP